MVSFHQENNKIIFSYSPENDPEENWMVKLIEKDDEVYYKNTFTFTPQLVHKLPDPIVEEQYPFDGPDPIEFVFAERNGDYFKVIKGILSDEYDIYIDAETQLDIKFFVADKKISILNTVLGLIKADIYIGGNNQQSIPIEAYRDLLSQFPNTYEKSLYAQARVSGIIRQYIETSEDVEKKYQKYLNKKVSKQGPNLLKTFQEIDTIKYQTILEKMKNMLKNENAYNEKNWQEEILHIILLLYPKYIFAFREVPIKVNTTRYLDYMLVDSSGHTDILEIKKPSDNSILTRAVYRDNYIPLRELSGTIMQIEKYIFYLNRYAPKIEKELTEKYKNDLPAEFTIKITNPSGLIIMGRDNYLSDEQKMDFEVVKRKYKNVVDIITYDELLKRLQFTIEQVKKI